MPFEKATENNVSMTGRHILKYLALGDSYTIGEGVAQNERFPYLTTSLLRRQGFSIKDPSYLATTGWTSADLLDALDHTQFEEAFDVVSLLIGVNDQYQHLDTASYRNRFITLLHKAIVLAGNRKNRVFVLSIPDYSCTPFVAPQYKSRIQKDVEQFNAINKQIALQSNVVYIDITQLTREAANNATLLAEDGLHYSAKEHLLWATLLTEEMKKILP